MSVAVFRPRQLVIWVLLALLILAILLIEKTGILTPKVSTDRHGHVMQETANFLPAPVADLTAIEIAHGGDVHRFERDQDGAWFYHNHHHEEADDHGDEAGHGHKADHTYHAADEAHHHNDDHTKERIEQTFGALGRAKIERYLERAQKPAEFGVTKPDMLINIYGENTLRPLARYAVGDIAPDTFSRYVMVVGSFAIITIPNYQIENLSSLTDFVSSARPKH